MFVDLHSATGQKERLMIPLLSRSVSKFREGRGSDSLLRARSAVGLRSAVEKRKSEDSRTEHRSIPAFKIAQTPRAHTARGSDHGVESASLIRCFASHVP